MSSGITTRRALLGLLALAPVGCLPGAPSAAFAPVPDRKGAQLKLWQLALRYEQMMRSHGLLMLDSFGAEGAAPGAERKLAALRADEEKLFLEAERLLEYHDALIAPRQAKLWQLAALGIRLLADPESQRLADELRGLQARAPELDGRKISRADLSKLTRSPHPGDREAALRSHAAANAEAAPVAQALLLRRRARARELGEDYLSAMLRLRHVGQGRMTRLFEQLVRGSDDAMRQLNLRIMRAARGRRLMAKDTAWALERVAPIPDEWFPEGKAVTVAQRIHAALGFDLSSVKLVAQEFAFSGQAISISVPDDVRLLVRPGPGLRLYATLLHEFGHAVASRELTETHPLYKSYEWVPGLAEPAFDEGLAEVFGQLPSFTAPLVSQFGLSAGQAARVAESRRLHLLHAVRRRVAWSSFEQRALANPRQDLTRLAAELEKRVLGVTDSAGLWATNALLPDYPVYGQSYALASMFAMQVLSQLGGFEAGGAGLVSTASGVQIRKHLLAAGMRTSGDEKLLEMTGRRLSAEALLAYLVTPPRPRRAEPVITL